MKLPFVSRARLEDAQRLVAELSEERRILLDRILQASGQKPLFARDPAAAPEASTVKEEEQIPEPPRRTTPRDVIKFAESHKRAKA